MSASPTPDRLLILSCSMMKRDGPKWMPASEYAVWHIPSLTEQGRQPFDEVCLVGGALHLDVMRQRMTTWLQQIPDGGR